MFRKPIVHLLVSALVLSLLLAPSVTAQTNKLTESERVAQLKTKLAKLGTGKKARVEIKLSDNTNRTGYLSQVNENSFVLTDAKTGQNAEFAYNNIAAVKKPGVPGWAWGVIIVGGVVGGLFILGHTALPNLGS
jgi:hypothetical protein